MCGVGADGALDHCLAGAPLDPDLLAAIRTAGRA